MCVFAKFIRTFHFVVGTTITLVSTIIPVIQVSTDIFEVRIELMHLMKGHIISHRSALFEPFELRYT